MEAPGRRLEQGYIVRGCGTSKFVGTYWPDIGARQGAGYTRPFRQEGGQCTIEYYATNGWWYLTERYGYGTASYFCESPSRTPPGHRLEPPVHCPVPLDRLANGSMRTGIPWL